MKGYEIKFNIYAETPEEVEDARLAIVAFINQHAQQGRAVTARKVAGAVRDWGRNPIVKNTIIKYFQ